MSALALVDDKPGTTPRYIPQVNADQMRKTGRTVFSPLALPSSPLMGIYAIHEGELCVFSKAGITGPSPQQATTGWGALRSEDVWAKACAIRNVTPWAKQADSQQLFLPILSPWAAPREMEFPIASAPPELRYFAMRVWRAIPYGVRLPKVWAEEGEIAFEWKWGKRHAILSIEEDGTIGYAMDHGGEFLPGSEVASLDALPRDLLEYLGEK